MKELAWLFRAVNIALGIFFWMSAMMSLFIAYIRSWSGNNTSFVDSDFLRLALVFGVLSITCNIQLVCEFLYKIARSKGVI